MAACCACEVFADDDAPGCFDNPEWRRARKGAAQKGKTCAWLAAKGATKSKCAFSVDAAGVPAQTACGCVCGDFA